MTAWQARACELALKPICVCRCGGALHGKDHTAFLKAVNGLLEQSGEIDDKDMEYILDEIS